MTTVRRVILVCGLAALIAASYFISTSNRKTAPAPQAAVPTPGPLAPSGGNEVHASAEPVIEVNATNVLASVNGREIKLADLVPLNPGQTNQDQQFSPLTYHYLLNRAINRELILQTAKAQGVTLDESQQEQLARYRSERMQREPGLVQRLNLDEAVVDLEVRDSEAFMLQTTLLANAGASPNVSEQAARDYYSQHADEYAPLPADEPARSETWANIEVQVRSLLAPIQRANYQTQLAAYMDQLRSSANIAQTPTP